MGGCIVLGMTASQVQQLQWSWHGMWGRALLLVPLVPLPCSPACYCHGCCSAAALSEGCILPCRIRLQLWSFKLLRGWSKQHRRGAQLAGEKKRT